MSEETDAIVTDAEELEQPLTGRNAAMAEIIAKNRGEQTEGLDVETDPIEQEDEIVLKVDGQEVKTSRDKVIEAGTRALQKESSADRRLEEATRARAEAEAKEAELNQRRADLDALEQQLLSKAEDTTDPDEFGREFEESLFTEDGKVASTMSELKREIDELKGNVTKVSTDVERVGTVVQTVEEREQNKMAADKQTATTHFHTNYLDIASDQRKLVIFNDELNKVMSSGEPASITDAVDQAAEALYSWMGNRPKTQKASKKDTLIKQPKGGSRRKAPPPAEKQKTRSDVIAEMRNSRGLR